MLLGLITFELHIPHSRSLKDKRRVVRGLVDRIHHRYQVSVIESDFHDLHQRAEIAIAMVALSEPEIHRMFIKLRTLADQALEADITLWNESVLEAL
jgi:uncharacterized protein YlxP (DUF503 family)